MYCNDMSVNTQTAPTQFNTETATNVAKAITLALHTGHAIFQHGRLSKYFESKANINYGSFLVPLCDFFLFVLPTLKLVKSTLMSIKSTLKLVKSTLKSV